MPMSHRRFTILLFAVLIGLRSGAVNAEEYVLHSFERTELTDVYYSEGAGAGDLNNDGHVDIVYGPYWFAGPDFKTKREIYPAVPQRREGYADNFFSWVHDFNGDDCNDVFVVGFPGTPAYVYENPGADGLDQPWTKHEVFDWVSNESPHFVNIVGDERPELVCTRDGHFGYATVDWEHPFAAWTFHAVSEQVTAARFGHGLGVGDLNGDGLADIIHAGGWYEQPESSPGESLWTQHEVKFTNAYGGAEMYAYDVDGDGDNDVITSLAAHDFGLAWYEQVPDGDDRAFRMHVIMGSRPEQNKYGVVFSELHSVNLVDMDGDGLKDIVTGKTYYSHHEQSPMWDAGAVVYWFKLVRGAEGVDWIPYQADGDSGIGRQVGVFHVDGDDLPDIVVGGIKGASVLLHRESIVEKEAWQAAQPKVHEGGAERSDRGKPSKIDDASGKVAGAIEAEAMKMATIGGGNVHTQAMGSFSADRWSGNEQLFWTGAKPRARLELDFEVAEPGEYEVATCFTVARDYGIINVILDGEALCEPLDLFNDLVATTGVLEHGTRKLDAGTHRLRLELIGANDAAVKSYMVGFDYLLLTPAK